MRQNRSSVSMANSFKIIHLTKGNNFDNLGYMVIVTPFLSSASRPHRDGSYDANPALYSQPICESERAAMASSALEA
jgi:hypothetical protein